MGNDVLSRFSPDIAAFSHCRLPAASDILSDEHVAT